MVQGSPDGRYREPQVLLRYELHPVHRQPRDGHEKQPPGPVGLERLRRRGRAGPSRGPTPSSQGEPAPPRIHRESNWDLDGYGTAATAEGRAQVLQGGRVYLLSRAANLAAISLACARRQ